MVEISSCSVASSKNNKSDLCDAYTIVNTRDFFKKIFQVVPDGLRQLLKWLKNEYGNPPLIITENGYGDGGQLNDTERINYLTVNIFT